MSNINTTYALFRVEDYKKDNVLSSFNLPITPLTFVADIPSGCTILQDLNNSTATFDLGDGTIVHSTTATHSYKLPGRYKVRMILRDCQNNNVLASYSENVDITDYVENTFSVSIPNNTLTLSAGHFSEAITITNSSPFYQTNNDIFYGVSGTNLPNYFDLAPYKFNHLKRYHAFYEKSFLTNLSADEFNEVPKLTLSSENIYIKLSGFNPPIIVPAKSTDPGSLLVGSSGTNNFYFSTDDPVDSPIKINLFKDRNKIFSRNKSGDFSLNDYNNNLGISLTANVEAVASMVNKISSLNATSNGLDSEGFEEATIFGVSPAQFKGIQIPFLVKPKSVQNFTVKNLSAIGTPVFTLTENGSNVSSSNFTIESLSSSIEGVDTKFWYYGGLTFNDSLSTQTNTLKLSISSLYNNGSTNLSLTSNVVTISTFPNGFYEFAKQNENVDFKEIFKSLRFQEILLDKNILFDDFIGSIFGDLSSSSSSLGKTLNSKIFNFVDNKIDLNKCDARSILSLSKLVNEEANVFDDTLFSFPPNVSRFISLFSTQFNNLKGTKNKFSQNLNENGESTKTVYGKNLGDEIDTTTYVVTAGTDIVAKEKFSNECVVLNSFQPLSSVDFLNGTTTEYSLSTYDSDWGWPLVLPSSFTFSDLDKFYKFYDYTSGIDGTVTGGLINFSDPKTTFNFDTPLSAFKGDNKIEDIVFRNSLFSSLSLFQ